jgi:hypothetical protein
MHLQSFYMQQKPERTILVVLKSHSEKLHITASVWHIPKRKATTLQIRSNSKICQYKLIGEIDGELSGICVEEGGH